jgi:DNA-binding winged helix-turn-helix (wHTH) protein
MNKATTSYRFDRFELDSATRQLLADGQPVALGARALDILLTLIERRERLVTKDELLELVWPGLVVEENNLQVQISALRKVLGAQTIATISGRGYRFAAAAHTWPNAFAWPVCRNDWTSALDYRSVKATAATAESARRRVSGFSEIRSPLRLKSVQVSSCGAGNVQSGR